MISGKLHVGCRVEPSKRLANPLMLTTSRRVGMPVAALYRCEGLEQRLFLSISATIVFDPETTPGNVAVYEMIPAGGTPVPGDTDTAAGATTFDGQPAFEVDEASGTSGSATTVIKRYIALTSAGVVEYGEGSQVFNSNRILVGSTVSNFSPPQVTFPTELVAGQMFTATTTKTAIMYPVGGTSTTTTSAITDSGTLVSDATQPIVVPAGTYDCYQVNRVETRVIQSLGPDGMPVTTTTVVNETDYIAQGVGIVESSVVVENGASYTDELSSFTDNERLVFQPPALVNVPSGDPMQPAFTVALEDSTSDVDTSDNTTVVTLTPNGVNANNPITGNTATMVDGVATFSDVVLTKAGVYQLQASDSDNDPIAISNKFGVTGDKLMFASVSNSVDPNEPILVKVEALKPDGTVDTSLADTVALSLNTVSGGTGAVLSGKLVEPLIGGRATFAASAGVSVNAGGSYTLTASPLTGGSTDYTASGGMSSPFTVEGLKLAVKQQPPKSVDMLAPIPLAIQVVDAKGKLDKSENSAQVQLSLISSAAGATLGGTLIATFKAGVATFPVSAAPTIDGAGMFMLAAAEIGSPEPAISNNTRSFLVLGDRLKLVTKPDPYTAANTDVAGDAYSTAIFAVYDAQGHPVTNTGNLPSAQISGQAVSGNGQLNTSGVETASDFIPKQLVDLDATIPLSVGTTQANYAFHVTFTAVGTYSVTISAVPPAGGSAMSTLFQPLTITCQAINPSLEASSLKLTANEPGTIELGLVRSAKSIIQDFYNNLGPQNSVGISLTLASSSSGGMISGDAAAGFTSESVSSSTVTYSYEEARLSVSFDKPGLYVLTATEVMSAGGQSFDPSSATPVATTDTISFNVRVLPDRVVVSQQPPNNTSAGTPFTFALELEDSQGNPLTDQEFDPTDQIVAVVTAANTRGSSISPVPAPVPFNGGVAMVTAMISTPGVYRLHIEVDALVNDVLSPIGPAAGLVTKTTVFRIS